MTMFEEFATGVIGKVETDADGMYTKYTHELAIITNDIILSDDEEIFNLPWEDQKELIKKRILQNIPLHGTLTHSTLAVV